MIGEGEVVSLADYATEHFRKHGGRPLRIAVDEAGWRFSNLTDFQVDEIRKKEPAANPIEKTILWRILSLMKLNIKLIFVFDGMKRPWKRGRRGGGKYDLERIRLLQQLLDHLKIPRHQAPGEAEAECAKMQAMGIVDAVWSDDSDTFMFGATCKIEAHKENGKRVQGKVRIHQSEKILADHGLDSDSLVLFALLAGGDYNQKGLSGCGPQTTKLVADRKTGLASELRRITKPQLPQWRARLHEALRSMGKTVEVPASFPDFKVLHNYREPTVSTDEQMHNLRGLRQGWDRPIDQTKLRVLLRQRFNFETREYMKHIAPIFMVTELARCKSDDARVSNMRFDIQLKRTRQKNVQPGEEPEPTPAEVKVTFYPLPAIEIDVSTQPDDEDWSKWEKNGSHYSASERVETELLTCFMERGLAQMPTVPEPASKSRKKAKESAAPTSETGATAQAISADTIGADERLAEASAPSTQSSQKKRGRPPKDKSETGEKAPPKKQRKKATEAAGLPPSPPPAGFRLPRALAEGLVSKCKSRIVDLCLDESDSEQALPSYDASRLAGPSSRRSSPLHFSSPEPSPSRTATETPLDLGSSILRTAAAPVVNAGQTINLPLSPRSLRAKRLAHLADRTSSSMPTVAPAKQTMRVEPPASAAFEIVDLT